MRRRGCATKGSASLTHAGLCDFPVEIKAVERLRMLCSSVENVFCVSNLDYSFYTNVLSALLYLPHEEKNISAVKFLICCSSGVSYLICISSEQKAPLDTRGAGVLAGKYNIGDRERERELKVSVLVVVLWMTRG